MAKSVSVFPWKECNKIWASVLLRAANLPAGDLSMQPGAVSLFGGPGSGKSTFARRLFVDFQEAGMIGDAKSKEQNLHFVGTEPEYGPGGIARFATLLGRVPKEGDVFIVDSAVLLTLFDYYSVIADRASEEGVFPETGTTESPILVPLKASRSAGIEPRYLASLVLLNEIYAKHNALVIIVDNPLAPEESNQSNSWLLAEDGLLAGAIMLAKRTVVRCSLRTWTQAGEDYVTSRTLHTVGDADGTENLFNLISNI